MRAEAKLARTAEELQRSNMRQARVAEEQAAEPRALATASVDECSVRFLCFNQMKNEPNLERYNPLSARLVAQRAYNPSPCRTLRTLRLAASPPHAVCDRTGLYEPCGQIQRRDGL